MAQTTKEDLLLLGEFSLRSGVPMEVTGAIGRAIVDAKRCAELEAENQRLRAVIDQAERKAYGVAAMLTEAIAGPTEEDTEHDSPV